MPYSIRSVIGWATSIIPPFFGLWIWYLWWAEPVEWDNLVFLIGWMKDGNRRPGLGETHLSAASWFTPRGEMILWKDGDISLHGGGKEAQMCGFTGGVIGYIKMNELRSLCVSAIKEAQK